MERRATPLRPVEIEQRLRTRLGYRAVLAVSEDAQPASVLHQAEAVQVRIAPVLLHAPDVVLDALARFAQAPGDLEARALLHAFSDATPVQDEDAPETRGRFHDLAEIFTDVNGRFFAGAVAARIAWSRGSTEAKRH